MGRAEAYLRPAGGKAEGAHEHITRISFTIMMSSKRNLPS
jgi:hypothetical protein